MSWTRGRRPQFLPISARPRPRYARWSTRATVLGAVVVSLSLLSTTPTSAKGSADTAVISTIAGTGGSGLTGNKGPALQAELSGPCGLARDAAGNILFSDTNNNVVRVLAEATGTFYGQSMTAGDVYALAGNGQEDYKGNGKAPLKAEMDEPDAITVDPAGNVIISDTENEVVRYIPVHSGTQFGIAMSAGNLYTIAGNTNDGYSGSGGPGTKAAIGLDTVAGVAVDANGNIIITDGDDNVIWALAATSGTFYGQAMTAGDVYIIAGNGNADYTGDGGPALAAAMDEPEGVAIDPAGNIVFVDDSNDVIRVVAEKTGTFYGKKMTTGDIYTIGPASDANKLNTPEGLIIDGEGNIVFADAGNNVVYLLATTSGTDDGISVKAKKLYEVAGNGTTGYTGDGGDPQKAELNSPCAVGTDVQGNLLIADGGNNVIRKVTP